MIPKIIHYCWFGGKVKPESVLKCIESWKIHLPDYEIKEWNEANFPIGDWRYAKEAYLLKKYAFVSDVCRLYALDKEGGIYLDTDVEVLKSFDPFLKHDSFIGEEVSNYIGTAVIGASKECPWIKELLSQYRNRHFIQLNGQIDVTTNVIVTTDYLRNINVSESKPEIYPIEYFCANDWTAKKLCVTVKTICIHHYDGSWADNDKSCQKEKISRYKIYKYLTKNLLIRIKVSLSLFFKNSRR